jgi:hypothetical protein
MTVQFELDGQEFTALNGGPLYKFTEAVSFVVNCDTQAEVDHYWGKLSEGGEEVQCGWLKDRFGLAWQVTPEDPDRARHGQGSREGQASLRRHAADEEARHRDAGARRRRTLTLGDRVLHRRLLHRRAEAGGHHAVARSQTPPGSNSTVPSPARRAPITSTK